MKSVPTLFINQVYQPAIINHVICVFCASVVYADINKGFRECAIQGNASLCIMRNTNLKQFIACFKFYQMPLELGLTSATSDTIFLLSFKMLSSDYDK